MNATAEGPASSDSSISTPAFFAAIFVSVFFTTEYLVSVPSDRRSCFIDVTERPRYSVSTVALAVRKSSVSSATADSLSGRAIWLPFAHKIKKPRRINAHEVTCAPMRVVFRHLTLLRLFALT